MIAPEVIAPAVIAPERTASEVIVISTAAGQITFATPNILDLWGYPVEQILNRNLFGLLNLPADPPCGTFLHTPAQHPSQRLSITLTRAHLADQLAYICTARLAGIPNPSPLHPPPGLAPYLTLVPGDPERAAEKSIGQGLALLMGQQGIHSAAMLDVVNADHTILFVNDRFCEVSGYRREELLGKTHALLNSDHHPPEFFQGIWEALRQGQIWQGEICHRHKSGSLYWVDCVLIPFLQAGQGSPFQYLAIRFDITERKQIQAQLALSHEQLLWANRQKDEFLASMSHELRTPLNTILGMMEGLQDHVFGEINAAQRKALQAIERSGSHLLDLINDILDFAKMEAGQLSLDKRPMDMIALCEACLVLLRPQAEQKQIHVAIQHAVALPKIHADERRIRQVLISLLSNAIKFTPPGGSIILSTAIVSPRDPVPSHPGIVRVSVFRPQRGPVTPKLDPDHVLRLSVADTGIGIAPRDQGRLFQPFVQLDSALNREYPGTGLGLAVVKRIIEQHGGQVSVTSELNVGSCFTVDLPVLCPSPSPPPPSRERPPAPTASRTPLIVLAADNAAEINTLMSYLQAKGYQLLVAKEEDEVLTLIRQSPPQIILIDAAWAGGACLNTLRSLRRDPHGATLPILVLREPEWDRDRQSCLEAGATEALDKPVKLKQLVALLQQYLSPLES